MAVGPFTSFVVSCGTPLSVSRELTTNFLEFHEAACCRLLIVQDAVASVAQGFDRNERTSCKGGCFGRGKLIITCE